MKVGIRAHFDSMHSLPGHPKCARPHGHTYTVEVEVDGEPVDGMVMDFDQLKQAVREVLAAFDHANLNELVDYPSCEMITLEIHKRLRALLDSRPMRVRVWEGEGKWAEHSA